MRLTFLLTAIFMMAASMCTANDGSKSADMNKPVKVFIMMGQSNMLQYGKLGSPDGSQPKTVYSGIKAGKYTYLVDADKNFKERKDVRYIHTMQGRGIMTQEWLGAKKKVGVELGTGWNLGDHFSEPVLMLKAAIGNRGLGWDLLPPSVGRYKVNGQEFPGYQEYKDGGKILKFEKGVSKVIGRKGKNKGKPVDPWYAGKNYDDDTNNAKAVLADLGKNYPGAKKYEVAGFFWWQGAKDQNPNHSSRYEVHLVELIKSLRKEFNAPNAPFVVATLGIPDGKLSDDNSTHKIVAAQLAVDGRGSNPKYKEFKDNVATVDTRKFYGGSSANGHYGGNGEFYMEVGDEMGKAMVELFKKKK